jgi:hypothetical protein
MHLTVPNIRKKMIKMSPHPKDGNMYKGFFCKHKTLNETVALQCSTFLFYIIRRCVKDQSTCIKDQGVVFMYLFCRNTAVIIDSSYFNSITYHYNLKKYSRHRSLQIGILCALFSLSTPVHRFEVDSTYSRQM